MLGIEQFEIGHEHGGSHDHLSIVRLSYHTPEYVRLAKEAYAGWETVEADLGDPLLVKIGELDFAPPNSFIPIADYAESLRAENVLFEMLDPAEVMRRWLHLPLQNVTLNGEEPFFKYYELLVISVTFSSLVSGKRGLSSGLGTAMGKNALR